MRWDRRRKNGVLLCGSRAHRGAAAVTAAAEAATAASKSSVPSTAPPDEPATE